VNTLLFHEFLESQDTLCVLKGNDRLFTSQENFLFPLLEYIDKLSHLHSQVTILDKTVGNAAALLAIKAGASRVYSPLGSQLAAGTLSRYHREYHFTEIVPFIRARNGMDMCPMEKLSLTGDMNPDGFYEAVKRYYEEDNQELDLT
jgi:hypothetical protein